VSRNGIGFSCAVLIGALGAIAQAQAPAGDSTPRETASGQPGMPRRVHVGSRPNFGAATTVWQSLTASDFDPGSMCSSGCTVSTNTWLFTLSNRAYLLSGEPRLFASPRLPGGARLTGLEYDYCDNGGSSGRLTIKVYLCNSVGDCSAVPYHTHTSLASEGCMSVFYDSLPLYTVDNVNAKILVEATFGQNGAFLQLAGVSFGYTLQVSPAPATPTFGDVPVTDPAFQYIEALVASGVTAGCGGGNYCPNSPLTRRQMAVFLAKALGLNWSQ
jgi:hypothetical protein